MRLADKVDDEIYTGTVGFLEDFGGEVGGFVVDAMSGAEGCGGKVEFGGS